MSPHYGLDPLDIFENIYYLKNVFFGGSHYYYEAESLLHNNSGSGVQFPIKTMGPYKKNLSEPEDQR